MRGVPLRHDIMVGNQHPVQRPRRSDQFLPRARKNKFFNQRIDRRVFNADIIAPARAVGGG